jgi:hypothetical protein
MPTEPKRWPKTAESMRQEAAELADDGAAMLGKARRELHNNKLLAEVLIADTQRNLERIRHLMKEAKQGQE